MLEKLTLDVVDQAPDVTPSEVIDEEALLQDLAVLSPIAYDRRREEAAKLLGIRVATLDAEVTARRPRQDTLNGAGTPVLFTDPEPWPDAVDGPHLLEALSALYTRYIVLPEGAADMLALWTMHTYTHAASQNTPRVGIESPQKRCGKTTLLALIGALAARPLPASNITPAALFRAIEQWQPTMLIDEADTFLPANDELRGVLNAGHTRSQAYAIRTVGEDHEPRAFCVWAPVAIALIGKLPSTVADRAIVIKMRRKLRTEHVERLRLDRLGDTEVLRRRCLRWAQDHLAQLETCDPTMPDSLHDRAADNWRPVCAIAEVAGGEWPQRAARAMKALTPPDLDDESAGVLLLEDFHQLFTTEQTDRLASRDVVSALHKLEERPWSEWGRQEKPITERQVARLLSPFGIKSKTIRLGTDTPKGYEREDFTDAWARYLPLLSATASATTPQTSNDAGFRAIASATPQHPRSATTPQVSNDTGFRASSSATTSNGAGVADEDSRNPALQADCGGVADHHQNHVADRTARNPASDNGCGGVADHTPVFEGLQDKGTLLGAHCPMGGHHTWLKRGSGGRLCARCNAEEK